MKNDAYYYVIIYRDERGSVSGWVPATQSIPSNASGVLTDFFVDRESHPPSNEMAKDAFEALQKHL
jgi:hypothetical protein